MNKNSMKRATAAVCVGALLAVAQPAYAGDGNSLDRARVNQKVKFLEEVIDEYICLTAMPSRWRKGSTRVCSMAWGMFIRSTTRRKNTLD